MSDAASLPVLGPLCSLRENAAQGRFVVARTDLAAPLPEATVVCSSSVHAVAVMETWRKRVCARCFKVAAKRLECHCTVCNQAFYCSESCRDIHAAAGSPGTSAHGTLCPALATLGRGKKFGKENVAMLRLMLELVARDLVGPALDGALGGAGLRFDAMQRHPPTWGDKERRDWEKLFLLLEDALAQCEWWRVLPQEPPYEWQHMLSRIDSNVFGCFSKLESGHLFGQGMYLEAALFNHSCDPNCAVSSGVTPLQIVTIREVQPGEELTIAYVEISQPRSSRQAKLSENYCFDCGCPRCASEGDELTQSADETSAAVGALPATVDSATAAAQKRIDMKGTKSKGQRTKAELRARREERQRAALEAQQRRGASQQEAHAPEPTPEPALVLGRCEDDVAAVVIDEDDL